MRRKRYTRMGRIIVYPPGHPAVTILYTIVGFTAGMITLVTLATAESVTGTRTIIPVIVAVFLSLSPALSWFNIVVTDVETGRFRIGYEIRVVYNIGVPVPLPVLKLERERLIIAVNIGGAVIPVLVAAVLVYHASMINPGLLGEAVVSVAVVSAFSYAMSTYIEGIGIVVPGFILALIAGSTALLQAGTGLDAAAIAYASGSVGSLIGADILRLLRERKRLRGFLSIGGAGVFDGIYMTGLLALLLVA